MIKMKAVVLLSGGLDSAGSLAHALKRNQRECHALTIDYGQRNWKTERQCAWDIAQHFEVRGHSILTLDHALLKAASPVTGAVMSANTYVPSRNLLLLSHAFALAEILQADEVYFGSNADDAGFYPDCRGQFVDAFADAANAGAKRAKPISIVTPWTLKTKVQVVKDCVDLGVPFDKTTTCLMGRVTGQECGKCRACELRIAGFSGAGVIDPLEYASCAAGITRNG